MKYRHVKAKKHIILSNLRGQFNAERYKNDKLYYSVILIGLFLIVAIFGSKDFSGKEYCVEKNGYEYCESVSE